ncbi:MAG: gamma-glutamylcyclotransferase [Synergistaceae bacterium]|nr:gamma-glutamylcyclotransferase [Synergistaceae bacterium]
MSERYYIAYGSNMSAGDMRERTPEAVLAGKTTLKGWRLQFRYGANIVRDEASQTPAIIWKISPQDEMSLDRYEDVPDFYVKEEWTIPVESLDGRDLGELTALVYIMTEEAVKEKSANPVSPGWYYEIIRKAYEAFGFDTGILEEALEESRRVPR